MKILTLFLLLIAARYLRHEMTSPEEQYRADFAACTDYTDYSCEMCEMLLDGKERHIITAVYSEDGISVQFTDGNDTLALDYLTEAEYKTLVSN